MLISLSVRDFVLIDRLEFTPGAGFTALTGETGAGKSIILEALALATGGAAERDQVRPGSEQASCAAEFDPGSDHPVYACLAQHGLRLEKGETLTLRRVVKASGPARAFVNDQPVSAGFLAEVGSHLVEIHGQYAASALMRPSMHRVLLDAYGGHGALCADVARAWESWRRCASVADAARQREQAAEARRALLAAAADDLARLAPEPGEADRLAEERLFLAQSEKLRETISEVDAALSGGVTSGLARAARAAERISRLPGLSAAGADMEGAARDLAAALERALIEVSEAEAGLAAIARRAGAGGRLESVEARLFALRAAARRHGCEADALAEFAGAIRDELAGIDDVSAERRRAEAEERAAYGRWRDAARALSEARSRAADRFATTVAAEMKRLRMDKARVRVAMSPIGETEAGTHGAERVEFEIETLAEAGFGPLRRVASGGELARLSLAMSCVLATRGPATTRVFDEADQGVGGAVAAAIGERLARLGRAGQVVAVTHSPQVAAAALAHWRVGKSDSGTLTLTLLDQAERREEIARMLSGVEVTAEARAAAGRLMEHA